MESYNEKTISVDQVMEYYNSVQKIMMKQYVFQYCLVNPKQNLYHSPSNFWKNSEQDQLYYDSIYTLWVLAQKNVDQKRKLLYLPYIPPHFGYDEDSFQGEFRTFYSKKDPVYLVRENILQLYKIT